MCNDVLHPLYGAMHELYVPARVTRGGAIAPRFTYAQPRSISGLSSRQYLYGTILVTCNRWCGAGWFQELCQCIFMPMPYPTDFTFSSYILWVGIMGLWTSD